MLHLYRDGFERRGPTIPYSVVLDVFTTQRGRPTRLASIHLGSSSGFSGLDVELRWLQPAKRQGPVLLLPLESGIRLFAFPTGWSGRRFTQDFPKSASSIYEFHQIDRRGFLMVAEIHSERPEGGDKPMVTTVPLRWTGRRFVR